MAFVVGVRRDKGLVFLGGRLDLRFRLIHGFAALATSGGTAILAIFPILLIIAAAPPSRPALAASGAMVPLTPPPPLFGATVPRLTVDSERVGTYGMGYDDASVPALRRYTVRPGDSLQSIARQMHLHVTSIQWANPGIGDQVRPGEQLIIPSVDGVLHLVGPGESAAALAHEYDINEQSLLDYNGLLSPSQLRVGMRLMIPNSKPPAWVALSDGGAISFQQSSYDNFPWGECTWYVAARRNIPWTGNAWSWLGSAEARGWPVGMTPRVGAIMVTWENPVYGHVAYVERVNADGSWVVSEMNYEGFGIVDERTIHPGQVPLIGFIY